MRTLNEIAQDIEQFAGSVGMKTDRRAQLMKLAKEVKEFKQPEPEKKKKETK